jgi:hypothetical protein
MKEKIDLQKGFSLNFLLVAIIIGFLFMGGAYFLSMDAMRSSQTTSNQKESEAEKTQPSIQSSSTQGDISQEILLNEDNIESLKGEEITQFLVSWKKAFDDLEKSIGDIKVQLWQLSARVAELEKKEIESSVD